MADSNNNAPDKTEDETRIVMGFDEIELDNETVKVSEFTFTQELKALAIAEPIIKAIAELYVNSSEPDMLNIEKVFAMHAEVLVQLLSISTTKPVEWFNLLPGRYANTIFLTFWGVNSHFFTQRVVSQYVMTHPEILKESTQK